jgi:hypothetical protein
LVFAGKALIPFSCIASIASAAVTLVAAAAVCAAIAPAE